MGGYDWGEGQLACCLCNPEPFMMENGVMITYSHQGSSGVWTVYSNNEIPQLNPHPPKQITLADHIAPGQQPTP